MTNPIYQQVLEKVRFIDYLKCAEVDNVLRSKVDKIFGDFSAFEGLKMVGSAATGTMRVGAKDLDYAVIFAEEMSCLDFRERIVKSELDILKSNEEAKYNYIKVSGKIDDFDFVLVPVKDPRGRVENYVQDAFYHPDLIGRLRAPNHSDNVLLLKEFFIKLGLFKKVKGIGCELMTLKYVLFDSVLEALVKNTSLRINFSNNHSIYSDSPLIVDYPFLGGRSLNNPLSAEEYYKIQNFAYSVLESPKELLNGAISR